MDKTGLIYEYKGSRPRLGKNVFVAPTAIVLGNVEIGEASNVWFHTVIRGDVNAVMIGSHTNIQDHCMLHVTSDSYPLYVGNRVIVGHRAVLHGCTIGDNVLIGIGALVLDGAVVERGAIVAAGAVVTPGTVIPSNAVAMGAPAKVTRSRTSQERANHEATIYKYEAYALHFSEWVHQFPHTFEDK